MATYAGKLGFIPTPLAGLASRTAVTPHDYAGKLDVIPTPLSTGVWSRAAITTHDYLGYAMRWGDSTIPFPGDTGIIIGPATNLPEGVFVSADLLGSGTIDSSLTMWRAISADLLGEGTLDVALFRDLAFSAALPGLGTLVVDLQQVANITASFLGTGTLTANLLSRRWRPFAMERTDVEFSGITDTSLTASRLIATDGSSSLVSSDLYSWVTQTVNQVLIADDGDGTVTFSLPQDIHTGAAPQFNSLKLGTGYIEILTGSTLTFEASTSAFMNVNYLASVGGFGTWQWSGIDQRFQMFNDFLFTNAERIYFRDTGLYIYSSVNGQLDIIADILLRLSGAIRLSSYSTDGLLKTTSGDGTLAIATAGTDYLTDIVQDTTPQLGGDLDGQSLYDIINVVDITASGLITAGDLDLTTTGSILNGLNGTFSGTVQAEQITSTDDITMSGHLMTLGDGSAQVDMNFVSSGGTGLIRYTTSDAFQINVNNVAVTKTINTSTTKLLINTLIQPSVANQTFKMLSFGGGLGKLPPTAQNITKVTFVESTCQIIPSGGIAYTGLITDFFMYDANLAYLGSTNPIVTNAVGYNVTGIPNNCTNRYAFRNLTTAQMYMGGDNTHAYWGAGNDIDIYHNSSDGKSYIVTDATQATDLVVDCGTDKTVELNEVVYDDLRVAATSVKVGASTYLPNWTQIATDGGGSRGVYSWGFPATPTKEVFFTVQLPHRYAENDLDLIPHLHYAPQSTNVGTVVWILEYTISNIDGTFGNTTTVTMTDTTSGTINDHLIAGGATISGSGLSISTMLVCRLYLDITASTFTGEAVFLEFDIHYPINTMGSRQEFIK